jgi:hypothetical protein
VVRPAPEVRKEIFLVTKDTPRTPSQMLKMVDQRLETLGTDTSTSSSSTASATITASTTRSTW